MLKNLNKSNLKFTGNWFIDAGILGFVNLMEEVYSWDLNTLQKKIKENEELVYYGYFPFAYIFDNLIFQLSKIKTIHKNKIREELFKYKEKFLKEIIPIQSSNELIIFNEIWKKIDEVSKEIWVEKKLSEIDKEKQKIENLREERNFQDFKQKILEVKDVIIHNEKNIREILEKKPREKISWHELESDKFLNIKNKIEELRNKLYIWWKEKDERKIFFRLPISNNFFTNFLIFQESWNYAQQKEGLKDLIGFNITTQPTFLGKLDKFVNKFLPSEEEFSNINYTEFSTKPFKNIYKYLFVYLLCFTHAFENFKNLGNVLFYSSDLEFTYLVNKQLKLKKKRAEDKKDPNIIFRITWNEIVNSLVEYKSAWSLENMYIIRYRRLDNQAQEDVEYIGIPKLQASVLLDDYIRNTLNVNIPTPKKDQRGKRIYVWLLEEFIKGKSLYSLALQHTKLRLTENTRINYSIFYALLIDAVILEFKEKEKRGETLFSENFFEDNYREILKKVKIEFRRLYYYSISETKRLIPDDDTRKRLSYLLLDSLYGNDKSRFLNILLKTLNLSKKIINPEFLDLIFEKIINNDKIWQRYALFLTAGMVSKS